MNMVRGLTRSHSILAVFGEIKEECFSDVKKFNVCGKVGGKMIVGTPI